MTTIRSASTPATAAAHVDADTREEPTTHFGSADEFVRKQLIGTGGRRVMAEGSGGGSRWKPARIGFTGTRRSSTVDDMPLSEPSRSADGLTVKVLNNNVLVVIDREGRERVLMGRGLGFGFRASDPIDFSKVEKTFVLNDAADPVHAREILTTTPYELAHAVAEEIEFAERALGRDLGRQIAVAVMDHLTFVLERLANGVRIPVAAMPELAVLYPAEFRAAEGLAAGVGRRLGVELPPEEAVFLTTHLLNATREVPGGQAALLFRRVQHIIVTVESFFEIELDTSSPDYARFVLHLKFLLQRLGSSTMLHGTDTSFFDFAALRYPRAAECAVGVRDYLAAATGVTLTKEEMLYVIVHVERLTQRIGTQDPPLS